jgi:hypothetical protein
LFASADFHLNFHDSDEKDEKLKDRVHFLLWDANQIGTDTLNAARKGLEEAASLILKALLGRLVPTPTPTPKGGVSLWEGNEPKLWPSRGNG